MCLPNMNNLNQNFNISAIATEMSVWEGVVVTPSDKAYEKPEKPEGDDDEGESGMETDTK